MAEQDDDLIRLVAGAARLGDVAGTPKLLEALADAGFSSEEVAAIAWDNWRRVLGAWWRE
jgi:membrane dipeptidase